LDSPEQLLLLPLWYVVFLLSLTCHEAAHALAARLGGDDTAYLGGQVTLNPIPHVRREPVGTLAIPFATFFMTGGSWMMGWASAPYDPLWEDRHPLRAAGMAIAGPLANLALFLVGFVILRIGLHQGVWIAPQGAYSYDQLVMPVAAGAGALDAVSRLASITLFLNLVLFLFNLLPLPPLDGASVLAGLLPPVRRLRDSLRESPLASLGGLVLAWMLFPRLFRPVWWLVEAALYT
jgi:Zn-dependent protease